MEQWTPITAGYQPFILDLPLNKSESSWLAFDKMIFNYLVDRPIVSSFLFMLVWSCGSFR